MPIHSPRLFSYTIPFDTGFSPNPFFGYCTLACCKPRIRLSARPGDWIAALSPRADGNRLVHAMHVAETLTFAEYWNDPRFAAKIPDLRVRDLERHCGDNIYEPLEDGGYRQHASAHAVGCGEDEAHKARDLGGRFVLIATDFVYLGGKAKELPGRFRGIIPGRAHRCNFLPETVEGFAAWVSSLGFGVHGAPTLWPPAWSRTRSCGSCPPERAGAERSARC